MTQDRGPGRLVAGVAFTLATIIVGATAGGIVARLTETSGMGWDQIARALGGVAIGALPGVVVAVWGIRRLSAATFGKVVTVAVVLAVALMAAGGIRVRQRMAAPAEASTTPMPTAPTAVPR